MADVRRHEVVRVARVDDHLRSDPAARAERPRRQRGAQRVRAGGQGGRRYGYPSHRRRAFGAGLQRLLCGFLYRATAKVISLQLEWCDQQALQKQQALCRAVIRSTSASTSFYSLSLQVPLVPASKVLEDSPGPIRFLRAIV